MTPNYKLRQLREHRGYSQRDVARLSGVSIRVVQAYEQGQNKLLNAKLRTICKIALALNASILDVVEDDEIVKKYFE